MFIQHHIHFRCQNLNATRDFYVNILGAQELRHYTTATGTEIILLRLNDSNLALSPLTGEAMTGPGLQLGIYQFALQVEDLAAAVDTLVARGAKLRSRDGKVVVEPTPGVKAVFIDAPDGVELELMEDGHLPVGPAGGRSFSDC